METTAEVLHRRTVRRIRRVCEQFDRRDRERERARREADGRHAPPSDWEDEPQQPRRCTRCGGSFPAEDFPWQQTDGRRHSWCRGCNRSAQRAYRQSARSEQEQEHDPRAAEAAE